MTEKLAHRSLPYRWFRHLVESGGVVKLRYDVAANGKQELCLFGFEEEKRVELVKGVRRRTDQYAELCEWVAEQNSLSRSSKMSAELKAAELYAKAVGIDYEKQPDELVQSMMEAVKQIRTLNNLDFHDNNHESQPKM